MPLLPLPQLVVRDAGFYELGSAGYVTACGPTEAVRQLRRAVFEETGFRVALRASKKSDIRLRIKADDGAPEGYQLKVDGDGIAIESSGEVGLFYGTQTLRQLIASGSSGKIPWIAIDDHPRFPWRGFMLDSARHYQPISRIKKILDQMALLKLNRLHWHLVDDQAWRLEILRFPNLTKTTQLRHRDEPNGRGIYTQPQVRALVQYALERHITIVPEIEIPAHTTVAMAAYPELTCTGEPAPATGSGIHTFVASTGKRIYCAAKPESLEFIDKVMEEVVELFPSPVIHVGGDERPDGIWENCHRCRGVMEQEGLPSEAALQRWFMERVARIVNSKGRRTMAWTPTVEFGVPAGEIVQDWFFGVIPSAVELGAEVVNSRDRFTYFDYPNFPGRQKPSWMPDLPVEKAYGFEPVPEGIDEAGQSQVLGAECSLWTEHLEDEDIEEALFPRMLAFAERVWSSRDVRDVDAFLLRVKELQPFLEAKGMRYARPGGVPRLAHPSRVETSMAAESPFFAECAFDGKFVRFFWTQAPPKEADHLTLVLAEPLPLRGIRLHTGSDIAYNDVLEEGLLEISIDGLQFETVARASGHLSEARFRPRMVKAVRLRIIKDMANRLAVREIVLVKAKRTRSNMDS